MYVCACVCVRACVCRRYGEGIVTGKERSVLTPPSAFLASFLGKKRRCGSRRDKATPRTPLPRAPCPPASPPAATSASPPSLPSIHPHWLWVQLIDTVHTAPPQMSSRISLYFKLSPHPSTHPHLHTHTRHTHAHTHTGHPPISSRCRITCWSGPSILPPATCTEPRTPH